jgi:hypothetical protein
VGRDEASIGQRVRKLNRNPVKTGQAAIEPRPSSPLDKIWRQFSHNNAYPAVVNYRAPPYIPSIIRISHFIYIHSCKPPKQSQIIPLSQIRTSFNFARITPNPQNILTSLLLSSFHLTYLISKLPIGNHRIVVSNLKWLQLYLWRHSNSAYAREVQKQNGPRGDRTSNMESPPEERAPILIWWRVSDGYEPPHTTTETLNYKIYKIYKIYSNLSFHILTVNRRFWTTPTDQIYRQL